MSHRCPDLNPRHLQQVGVYQAVGGKFGSTYPDVTPAPAPEGSPTQSARMPDNDPTPKSESTEVRGALPSPLEHKLSVIFELDIMQAIIDGMFFCGGFIGSRNKRKHFK